MSQKLREEMMRLFEDLIAVMEKFKKNVKREQIPSDLLYVIFSMNWNNVSKLFSESGTWVDPEVVDAMSEAGLIQKIPCEDGEKYALTFRGIARAIEMRYGIAFEQQFSKFLELSDQKLSAGNLSKLGWEEKLASMSLLMMASTSTSSAIRLNNEGNKTVLGEVFDKTLVCLKKYGIVEKEAKLRTKSRGESPVSALMSRLNVLTRKTNHYYKNIKDESGYFFDVEKDGDLDEKRLFFLLKRIFEHSRQGCNYEEMYKELAEISQRFLSRFRDRTINPLISYAILKKMKEFTDLEVWRLPSESQSELAGMEP